MLGAAGWRCGSCLRCDSGGGEGLTHHQPGDLSLSELPRKDEDVSVVPFTRFSSPSDLCEALSQASRRDALASSLCLAWD